jgi:chemotaxis protein MotB
VSTTEDRPSPHEIVIVRRKSGGHGDGHHGGAWKIAFADFMTALMCFFLVMWLINASDKKTVTQIATYFNPLRLNERITSQKGLDETDPKSATDVSREKARPNASPPEPKTKTRAKESAESDAANRSAQTERVLDVEIDLIRDPYGVIEQIVASQTSSIRTGPAASDARSQMPKDLFDPQGAAAGERRPDMPQSARDPTKPPLPAQVAADTSSPRSSVAKDELTADGLKSEIGEAMARLEAPLKPRVEVTDEGKEVLVIITDEIDQGMYAIGSSRPTPVLIAVMDAVGRALARKGGPIVVRGHTDARPYTAGPYDNWRLSSARAQVAYHMLVRGGLPPERVQRIEGHADRRLSLPSDPLAPQNRRIEILVAKEKS